MFSRREFLKSSSIISLAPALPMVFGKTAQATSVSADEKVLVVIQLDGGNDGLNTVVPFADDGYGRARSHLRLKTNDLHKLDDHSGLHSAMNAANELFQDGQLAIIQGVGYPNPNRSHFESMKIWHSANNGESNFGGHGWLGRAMDQSIVSSKSNPISNGIYVGEDQTPMAIWGRRSEAISLSRPDDLKLSSDPGLRDSQPAEDPLKQFVTKKVLSAYSTSKEFSKRSKISNTKSSYPGTRLGKQLELISQILKSGSKTRVFYTLQNGYDTHAGQLFEHASLLRQFSSALGSFMRDLKAASLDDRVVVLAFSEFGRRVNENDSKGTDHGTAGPVFVAGSQVNGGLFGKRPDLSDLDTGDLKVHTDFRSVYSTLLRNWLDVDPESVLKASFPELKFLG